MSKLYHALRFTLNEYLVWKCLSDPQISPATINSISKNTIEKTRYSFGNPFANPFGHLFRNPSKNPPKSLTPLKILPFKNVEPQKFWLPKILTPPKCWLPQRFYPLNFNPQNFWSPKRVTTKLLTPPKILIPLKFEPQKFWLPKVLTPPKFLPPKRVTHKTFDFWLRMKVLGVRAVWEFGVNKGVKLPRIMRRPLQPG